MNKKIILILVAVAAIAAVAWFVFIKKPIGGTLPEQAPEAQSGFGGSLYEKVAIENPVAKLPETNPFKANVNPFTGVYKNPFE